MLHVNLVVFVLKESTVLFTIVLCGEKQPDALRLGDYMFLGWLYMHCK